MTDLARLLPRHWDGQRLMRFLAGLAMLALGCLASAAPAAPAVEAAAPAPVTVVVAAPPAPAVAAAASHEIRTADRVEPCWNGAHIVVPAVAADVPGGVVPGAYGSRGPPAAA